MIDIRPEQPGDAAAIEYLLDEAFGADRHRKISYTFRRGVERIEGLCLAARDGDALVGTIRGWPIAVGTHEGPALLVGPVAVARARQGTGLGGQLIGEVLHRGRAIGLSLAVLVGDMSYYGRFGFTPAAGYGIIMPREVPARVLALALDPEIPPPSGELQPWDGRHGPRRATTKDHPSRAAKASAG
ncbi:MAG TPA: N-acetyltransferase [Stellaceae bacterium]|nr:N-acetyltransferase [Stellaceae bacterium]